MPDNYVDITVRARDNSKLGLDELKARLDELSKKVATAKVDVNDRGAELKLAAMQNRLDTVGRRVANPKISIAGAQKAYAEILAVDAGLEKMNAPAESAGKGLFSMVSPMGALIGAAVALSPVVVTLGFGLAGFGAAAVGVLRPLEKAATATGGLSKNIKTLPAELRPAAHGLLDLGKQFHQFSDSMKPQVLAAFGTGLRLAGHLMGDLQPVAKATGTALDGLLRRVDAEFQSGTWQQFFGFMARTAGPDIQLLGNAFITLLGDLPPLLQALQPVTVELLHMADTAVNLVGDLEHLATSTASTGTAAAGSQRHVNTFGKTLEWISGFKLSQNFWNLADSLTHSGVAAQKTGKDVAIVVPHVRDMSVAAGLARKNMLTMGAAADGTAGKMETLSQSIQDVKKAESHLAAATAYADALVTQKNDAHAFAQAMDKSHDKIGLNTQAQRNSFSTANTYIGDLINTAQKARDSGHGVAAQAAAIRGALPALENAKTKSHAYWAELAQLKAVYDALQREQNITKTITINYRPGTVPGFTNPGPPLRAHSSALQGSAMISGSPGGVAASVMSSVAATSAAAFSGAMHRYAPKPYYGHEKITNAFHQAPGWGHAPGPPVVISNGAELIAVLAKLLSEYARTHHGGSAQGAYGYGPG